MSLRIERDLGLLRERVEVLEKAFEASKSLLRRPDVQKLGECKWGVVLGGKALYVGRTRKECEAWLAGMQ